MFEMEYLTFVAIGMTIVDTPKVIHRKKGNKVVDTRRNMMSFLNQNGFIAVCEDTVECSSPVPSCLPELLSSTF